MLTTEKRATTATILAIAAVVCVCMFSEPIETAREGLVVPQSSLEADEVLMVVLEGEAAGEGAQPPSGANPGTLAARFRGNDANFQTQLVRLLAKEKHSRAKYFATKTALVTKLQHAKHDCKKRFAVQMENGDKAYLARLAELLGLPSTENAKQELKHDMQRMQESLEAALRSGSYASDAAVKQQYHARFVALKQHSSYYRAIAKLRSSSDWYPLYKARVGAHVVTCVKQMKGQISTATKLLQAKSKWFTLYSKLIQRSAWYARYKNEIAVQPDPATAAHHANAEHSSSTDLPTRPSEPSSTEMQYDAVPPAFLGVHLSSGLSNLDEDCVAKIHNSSPTLAHSLRADDETYKTAYQSLLEKDGGSREKFMAAKASLQAMADSAATLCQKKLAMEMEQGDSAYTTAYRALLSNPDTAAAKKHLQQQMAALQKQYTEAQHGKTGGAAATQVKADFEARFQSVKEQSPYYKQVQHLRRTSEWYPKYEAQLPAYVKSCEAKKKSDVSAAIVLLEHKSKWFKDYSALIKASAWYKKFEEQTAAELERCKNGKSMLPSPPTPPSPSAHTSTPEAAASSAVTPALPAHTTPSLPASAATPAPPSKVTTHALMHALKAAGAYQSATPAPTEETPPVYGSGEYHSSFSDEPAQPPGGNSYSSGELATAPPVPAAAPPVPAPVPPMVVQDRIKGALKAAQDALSGSNTTAEEDTAQDAVKDALKAAGVKDADNAGVIALAQHQLDVAKTWVEGVLHHQAGSLDAVDAYQSGARKAGVEQRRVVEDVIRTMIAVAESTENKEAEAQDRKDRHKARLKALDAPIAQARAAAADAQKSVQHAKAALAATPGTHARLESKKSLEDAEEALHDANTILATELARKDAIVSIRLRQDSAMLVGESELHYRAREAYHRAKRELKLVGAALEAVQEAHYAHKQALLKAKQEATKEKASKLAHKERDTKSEQNRKRRKIKAREEYAATLAGEALNAGEEAETYMKDAAKAGRIAAEKIMAAAEVKADLYKEQHSRHVNASEVAIHVAKESAAAILAEQAFTMASTALQPGSEVAQPGSLIGLGLSAGSRISAQQLKQAEQAATAAMPSDQDLEHWRSEQDMWKSYYKKLYHAKLIQSRKKQEEMDHVVKEELKREELAHPDDAAVTDFRMDDSLH